jgi:hypothetical protein
MNTKYELNTGIPGITGSVDKLMRFIEKEFGPGGYHFASRATATTGPVMAEYPEEGKKWCWYQRAVGNANGDGNVVIVFREQKDMVIAKLKFK